MSISANWLLATAAISLLLSLLLAWIASLIVYVKVGWLKSLFKAPFQLIRAHIDYLLMSLLLVLCFYLNERLNLDLPAFIIALLCLGALYNPLGFIVLAIKPQMANPETRADQIRILLGFVPATMGFGYTMYAVLRHLWS